MMRKMESQASDKSSPMKAQFGGIGMKLTQDYIIMRTKQALPDIKKINLWGKDINDVSVISCLTNVEVIGLTMNSISTLKDFASLTKLRELYLRGNQIVANLE